MASAAPEIPVLARDQAFETLYRRYVKDVYHYALALLRNPADAEDVTQTTFMNAYRAYKRGDEILKPQNWLIKIAHNVARTRYARASRRVKDVPLEDHVEQLALPEEDRPDVEAVLRALGRLPFNQRAALVMRELEGRSYVEIADTLGVSVSAVETLIFRGRRSLRLRASALRSLAAVPLPGSLTQLLGGGSVVAGGGAATGAGFLVKAAVALLTGAAVATGIGSDRSHPAEAAARPNSPAATASGWSLAPALAVHAATGGPGLTGTSPSGLTKGARAPGAHRRDGVALGATTRRHAPGTSASGSPAGTSAQRSDTTTTVAQTVAPVTNVVDSVKDTASGAVEALPVEVPPVPPLPVQVPTPTVPPVPLPLP